MTPTPLRILAILAALAAVLWQGPATAQQVLGRWTCSTTLNSQTYAGFYQKEYWRHYNTFRHYGRFTDPAQNVYEFEVFSASDAGVGGLWTNGQRHRETRVRFQLLQKGFVLTEMFGTRVIRYACR